MWEKFIIKNFNKVKDVNFKRAPLYESEGGSLTSGTLAIKLGASVDTLPPGKRCSPFHFHHVQEEMFIVLKGNGTLRIADEMVEIEEGDVICIPPGEAYPHQIINTSSLPLTYMSVSTMETPEVCEYPDSNKYLVKSTNQKEQGFRVADFRSRGVDYWEGEP
nr:cupin domain-containing protein [uncultured Enterobacter sp.]